MKHNLECSLEDLYHGTQKEFSIYHQVKDEEPLKNLQNI